MLFENSRKNCIGEAALHCDLKHRHVGVSQQVYGFIEAFDQDISFAECPVAARYTNNCYEQSL